MEIKPKVNPVTPTPWNGRTVHLQIGSEQLLQLLLLKTVLVVDGPQLHHAACDHLVVRFPGVYNTNQRLGLVPLELEVAILLVIVRLVESVDRTILRMSATRHSCIRLGVG